jgi:hypothetical protein
MQIPFFDYDLKKNVIMMPDRWVQKLSIEASQLLATSYSAGELEKAPKTLDGKTRSNRSHKNHPITKWANSSISNWLHVLNFAFQSIEEYKFRYEKENPFHIDFLNWCSDNIRNDIVDIGFTEPYKPIGYEDFEVCIAYQKYFNDKKQHIAQWRKRDVPEWFVLKIY